MSKAIHFSVGLKIAFLSVDFFILQSFSFLFLKLPASWNSILLEDVWPYVRL